MNCEQFRELLGPYLDGELGADERQAIEAHMAACPSCARELAELRYVNAAGKTKFVPEPTQDYWKNLTRSVMDEVRELDRTPAKPRLRLATIRSIIWPQQMRFRLVSLAASAAVVGVFVLLTFFREGKMQLPSVTRPEENVRAASGGAGLPDSAAPAVSMLAADSPAPGEEAKRSVKVALEKEAEPPDLGRAEAGGAASTPTPVYDAANSAAVNAPGVDEHQEFAEVSRSVQAMKSENLSESDSARIRTRFITAPETPKGTRPEVRDKLSVDAVRLKTTARAASVGTHEAEFENAFSLAQQTSDPAEKLLIWERFLKKPPEPEYQKRAIREMLRVHFDRAVNSDDGAIVQQSIAFFEANLDLFRHESEYESLEHMLERLMDRLKELQKK
ncbi:MAG: anti-sigma factor family protein [Candidatus Zhuqueibacterota bacterium]